MMERRSSMPRFLPAATTGALAVVMLLTASPAAAEREFYVGFHLGRTDVEVNADDALDQILDGDGNSRAYEIGFKFNDNFAVEAAYHDLSEVDGAVRPCAEGVPCSDIPIRGKINVLSVAIVPQYAITGRISVFAKVGIVSWGADLEDALDDFDVTLDDLDEEDLVYGVGAEFQLLGRLSLVGRFESIGGDIETVSVGARLGF
ncbi:MAG: porin family protein [Holophagales bacterium]|nr:porin family protein [Holophagales bacterium]MXX62810.1 porin family protein [Holophagales bacterium]MYC10470.1 porin family protein [Holophagales bacterium]MYD21858.1 porin family protein [Holophagales bacterium]MYI31945.1 porin family protein [Holophagales bacterium]